MSVSQLVPLTVNSEDPFGVHLLNLQVLDQACLNKAQFIVLSLGGYHPFRPSLAGSYLAAIRRCQVIGSKVAATAFSPLIGALVCLWLVADVRRLSPTAYLFLVPPPDEKEEEPIAARGSRDAEFLVPKVEAIISEAEAFAYRHCLQCVSEIVDIGSITGRALHEPELRELLLLGAMPECIAHPIDPECPTTSSPMEGEDLC